MRAITERFSITKKLLWTSLLQTESMKLDYYKLKEIYSKQAGVTEATLEHQIAEDVQRSFNSGGQQSKIYDLSLHNLLKLYEYFFYILDRLLAKFLYQKYIII